MNLMNGFKKTAAVALSAALAVGSISYASIVSEGADVAITDGTQTGNYISMPITIRDFASDGMLFEANLLGDYNADGSDKLITAYENGATIIKQAQDGCLGMTPTAKSGYYRYSATTSDADQQYISYYIDSKTRAQVRYAVVSYRTNGTYSAQPTVSHRLNATHYDYKNFDTAGYNNTGKWTTAKIDLGGGSDLVNYITIYPKLASGKYIDIAFVAFFATEADANALVAASASDDTEVETPVVAPTPVVDMGAITPNTSSYWTSTTASGYKRYTFSSSGYPSFITWTVSGYGVTRSQIRYLAIKYRTSANYTGGTPEIGHRASDGNHYLTFNTSGYNNTSSWASVVVDLGAGTSSVNYITLFTYLPKSAYIDIAYATLFDNEADALQYVAADGQTGTDVAPPTISTATKTYNHKNNLGFGLLATGVASHQNTLTDTAIEGSNKEYYGDYSAQTLPTAVVEDMKVTLNSGITQVLWGGLIRTNLVEGTLDKNKKLVYTEATVDYLATFMQTALAQTWESADGSQYQTWYVMGTKMFDDSGEYVGPNAATATKDLAQMLREQITGGLGSYAASKAKAAEPDGLTSYEDVTTYYDAAYFLLHNTFSDSVGYGKTVDAYNSLRLVEKQKEDGTVYYTFNSAYDGAVYDPVGHVIYNTQTTNITGRTKFQSTDLWYIRGHLQPANRFDPIGDLGYGKTGAIYYEYLQHLNAEYATDLETYYAETNYNMSLEGHAQFVYYQDADLYFTFTGDDDVYLFINGVRVLDLGGGHAISTASINLNDVASQLGLVDGNVYDFDFYYMERAGTAANFGIETNMKIVEPSMVTTKLGFQNGVSTGYNGYINPAQKVGYGFELQNSGNEQITNLTFDDAAIGVKLTKDAITLNDDSNLGEMYAIIYDEEENVKTRINAPNLTEAILKQMLADGLAAGEKIGIYGVKYLITSEDWAAGASFTNEVKTTAESRDNVTLNGYAEWKVQQQNHEYQCFDIYDKVDEGTQVGVILTKDDLLKPIRDKLGTLDNESELTIVLCSPSGQTNTTNLSKYATLDTTNYSITYASDQAGAETIYYKVMGGAWDNNVLHFHAYTYDVADDTFVLDYGLPVELYDTDYGFLANDDLLLSENSGATITVTNISGETVYGKFTSAAGSLKYTPNAFMDGADSVSITLRVMESGAEELTKFTGVELTQSITVVPANVVYYEDDFEGITYLDSDDNKWTHSGTNNAMQSPNQNSNYGSDPVYSNDQGAVDSNGTVGELNVQKTAKVLSFAFTGTGFEIVSRTTYGEYAVINVIVKDANEKIVRQMPVITESKGGHLYQVPVISIKGLTRGTYTVEVQAGGKFAADEAGTDYGVKRMFYLDGIRVFDPLSDADAQAYYNSGEYNAQFLKIKDLIKNGSAVYADASGATDSLQFATGTTLIEDVNSDGVLKSTSSLAEYLKNGPNNEIYLDGDAAVGMIVFYLTPEGDEGNRTIQIGAHRKVDSLTGANGCVTMTYGSTAEDIVNGTNQYTVYNGTEQYYTIDVNNLTMVGNQYLVMIGINGSENLGEVLSLTSLKISGYTISDIQSTLVSASSDGDLSDVSAVTEATKVYNQATNQAVSNDAE